LPKSTFYLAFPNPQHAVRAAMDGEYHSAQTVTIRRIYPKACPK